MSFRLASAAVGIPLLLVVTYVGGWPLVLAVSVVSVLAAGELARILRLEGIVSWYVRGWAGLVPFLSFLFPGVVDSALVFVAFFLLGLQTVLGMLREDNEIIQKIGIAAPGSLLGLVYPALALALLVSLSISNSSGQGYRAIWSILLTVWTGDTAAYFGGRSFGGRRLAPVLSPGKTVSGAVFALTATLAVGAILLPWFIPVRWYEGAFFGLIVGAAAQVGDLFESLLKRAGGVKDSGGIIPGHGGILDRFDSLAFAIPMAYLFFLWRGLV